MHHKFMSEKHFRQLQHEQLLYFKQQFELLNKKINKIMSVLETLQAQVAQAVTVEQSAITLLTGLKSKLDDALKNNDTAALQALSDTLGAETAQLAAAITANTPAAPVTDTPPVTDQPAA